VAESVWIIVNCNVITREDENPLRPSGVRLGSTSIMIRGMGETEAMGIVDLIDRTLTDRDRSSSLQRISSEVSELCRQFPVKWLDEN